MNPERELKKFIHYDTSTGSSTEKFAHDIGRRLKKSGFKVSYQSLSIKDKRHANVIGWRGPKGRPLLLCSHLDTVPPGNISKWTKTDGNPWKARVVGRKLYGLGAADDKGPLLAMLMASERIQTRKLKRPLVLAATFGEECGMPGARLMVKRWKGPRPFGALVGEPTRLGITYRHKGIGVLVLEAYSRHEESSTSPPKKRTRIFRGRQAHSARPWLGDNALQKALNTLGKQNVCIEAITSGDAANIIPDRAEIHFCHRGSRLYFPASGLAKSFQALRQVLKPMRIRKDRSFYPPGLTSNPTVARIRGQRQEFIVDFRLLPGQSVQRIHQAWLGKLRVLSRKDPNMKFRLRIERNNPPLGMSRHHPWVKSAAQILKKMRFPLKIVTKPSCTEAGIYRAWGVPSVVFGPGQAEKNIHAPNESISIGQIQKASRIYERAIKDYCG